MIGRAAYSRGGRARRRPSRPGASPGRPRGSRRRASSPTTSPTATYPASHKASGGSMASPLPPHSGSRTSERPKLSASTLPSAPRASPAATISAIASKEDRIRFIAKPLIRLSACAMLRIDRGSTASVTRAEPRSRRASSSIDAAIAESRAALTYLTTRKSLPEQAEQPGHDRAGRSSAGARCAAPRPSWRLTGSVPSSRAPSRIRPSRGRSANTAGRRGTSRPSWPPRCPRRRSARSNRGCGPSARSPACAVGRLRHDLTPPKARLVGASSPARSPGRQGWAMPTFH